MRYPSPLSGFSRVLGCSLLSLILIGGAVFHGGRSVVAARSSGEMLGYKAAAADGKGATLTSTSSEHAGAVSSTGKDKEGGGAVAVSENAAKPHVWSKGFTGAFGIILATEIGDETFIIAALLSMRNPRLLVFLGAYASLVIMTVLSTALGLALPALISRQRTHAAATVLYIFFGLRLFYIAYYSRSGTDEMAKEVDEIAEKLGSKDGTEDVRYWRRLLGKLFSPIVLEAFTLTFLAEWGDRSQIATIAIAAHEDPVAVTFGAAAGHAICTGIAVLGGKLLALKVSQRSVAILGGSLFLAFAIWNFFNPPGE